MSKLRDLGYIETLCHMYDQKLFGTTKISILGKVNGPLNGNVLKQAAHALYQHQPLLQSNIKFADDNFYFDQTTAFADVPVVIKNISSEQDAERHFTTELDKPLIASKYLWRLTLLTLANNQQRHFVFITIHHTIADGVSLVHLLEELLNYCHSLYLKGPLAVTPLAALPPIETLLPATFAWEEYVNYWRNYYEKKRLNPNFDAAPPPTGVPQFLTQQQEKLITTLPFAGAASFAKREHVLLGKTLSAEKVAKIYTASKAHATTIQAVLGAALLKAAQKMVGAPAALNIFTAVDFRTRCQEMVVPPGDLGCYTYTMSRRFALDIAAADFWALAHYYRQTLLTDIAEQKQSVIKDTKYTNLSTLVSFDELRNAKNFRLNFLVTNLGQVTFNKEFAPFKLESFRFLSSQMSGQYVLTLALQTFNGNTNLTFCYLKPLLSESWMQRFVLYFMAELDGACQ